MFMAGLRVGMATRIDEKPYQSSRMAMIVKVSQDKVEAIEPRTLDVITAKNLVS